MPCQANRLRVLGIRITRPNSASGFSLIEAIVVMGMVGILSLALAGLMSSALRTNRASELKSVIISKRNEILSAIQREDAWQNTITVIANSSGGFPNRPDVVLGLLNSKTVGPPDGWYELPVLMNGVGAYSMDYIENGNILIDVNTNNVTSAAESRGFDTSGRRCVGFGLDVDGSGPGSGSDACPFQYRVFWRPVCGTYPCTAPGVHYRLDFKYRPGPSLKSYAFNETLWSSPEMTRNDQNYLANFCTRFMGVWDGISCQFQKMPLCANGEKMLGVEVVGSPPNQTLIPKCEKTLSGATNLECPEGEKVMSMDESGTVTCSKNLAGASNLRCAAGQKALRIDEIGNVTCVATLHGAKDLSCPDGQKITTIDASGTVRCSANLEGAKKLVCEAGEKVEEIRPDGTVRCTRNLSGASDLSCRPGEVVRQIRSDGSVECVQDNTDGNSETCAFAPEVRWTIPSGINVRTGQQTSSCASVGIGYRFVDASWITFSDGCETLSDHGDIVTMDGCIMTSHVPVERAFHIRCCRSY